MKKLFTILLLVLQTACSTSSSQEDGAILSDIDFSIIVDSKILRLNQTIDMMKSELDNFDIEQAEYMKLSLIPGTGRAKIDGLSLKHTLFSAFYPIRRDYPSIILTDSGKTRRGIGVGSTVDEVLRRYGSNYSGQIKTETSPYSTISYKKFHDKDYYDEIRIEFKDGIVIRVVIVFNNSDTIP